MPPSVSGANSLEFTRIFPQLTEFGGDCAVTTKKLTIGESLAVLRSTRATADEYILWVLQAEKHVRKVTLLAGYAAIR